jgi:hypothetical protein
MDSTNVSEGWARLSRPALAVKVRAAVRDYAPTAADAPRLWSAVRENAVLAGQVRGLLNALRAETRDNRDSAMWEFKISAVWSLLTAEQQLQKPATATTARHSPAGRRRAPASDAMRTPRAVPPIGAETPAPQDSPARGTTTAGPRSAAVPAVEFVEPSAHRTG